MVYEFWENFRHNLFKPLLLFFYSGFLVPILGVKFDILSDASRDISRAYGVFDDKGLVSRRTTFVIDSKGIVQKVFMAQEALDPAHSLEACALLKEVK